LIIKIIKNKSNELFNGLLYYDYEKYL